MEEKKPKVYIEQAENLTKDGIEAIKKISDIEKKSKKEKLPMNFMANEFMNQQLNTLNKSNKEEKNANDATNGSTS